MFFSKPEKIKKKSFIRITAFSQFYRFESGGPFFFAIYFGWFVYDKMTLPPIKANFILRLLTQKKQKIASP